MQKQLSKSFDDGKADTTPVVKARLECSIIIAICFISSRNFYHGNNRGKKRQRREKEMNDICHSFLKSFPTTSAGCIFVLEKHILLKLVESLIHVHFAYV